MKKEALELAKHRIKRAREAFDDACMLLDRNSFNSAVNRFYYSAFYATRALLATKMLDSAKHSGVISLFQQHFVKTGIFGDVDIAKVLSRSFEKRQDSDYEDFVVPTKEEVQSLKKGVRKFIDKCASLLDEILKKQR